MAKEVASDDRGDLVFSDSKEGAIAPELVRLELQRIVTSRHFRTSRRGKEFLEYVVTEKMSGRGDLLKERLIGVRLFGRKPDYATGEDPVVRVQAGDVRRRLESYHADPEVQCDVLIQIPVGSYAPVFLLRPVYEPHEAPPSSAIQLPLAADEMPGASADGGLSEFSSSAPENSVYEAAPEPHPGLPAPEVDSRRVPWTRQMLSAWSFWRAGIAVLAFILLALCLTLSYLHRTPEGTARAFWAPASFSTKPVLICLPRAVVYRPSEALFDQYAATHPNSFTTREARRNQVLPLSPATALQWKDMTPDRSAGTSTGAVIAAVNIGQLLAEQGIRFELRFGEEATYADMRGSPVVLVGAINTEWSTELTAELTFVFDETRSAPNIHETSGTKRIWKMESSKGNISRDYGLITRQLSGKSGQFLVQVAGISYFGTEAASEFLVNKKGVADALRSASVDVKRNLQIVISTDVTAGRAGPPHVVAVSSW